MDEITDPEHIALKMIFEVQNKFLVNLKSAIGIVEEKITFMLLYNPKPINPSQRKEEYHKYWEAVNVELASLKKQVI